MADATLPSDWLGTPEASDFEKPAQYWQRVQAVHGGSMNADQAAYVQDAINKGIQPGAQFTAPTNAGGYSDPSSVTGAPASGYTDPSSAANPVQTQATNAQTYSTTPGAAPTQNTANQGAQDVLRNTLLDRATQGTTVDTNDPTFRAQADNYAATQERLRRNYQDDAAERLTAQGMGSSGAMDAERRFSNEQAANSTAGFEAQLAQSELMNRRQEISDALNGLGGLISGDQARALQKQLADLDAAIKRESLAQSGSLASQDLALRSQLGMGGLNLDALRTKLQSDQFNKSLGFNMADKEAYYNSLGLSQLLG